MNTSVAQLNIGDWKIRNVDSSEVFESSGIYTYDIYFETDGSNEWEAVEGYNPVNHCVERKMKLHVYDSNYVYDYLELIQDENGMVVVTGDEYLIGKLCSVYKLDNGVYVSGENAGIDLFYNGCIEFLNNYE